MSTRDEILGRLRSALKDPNLRYPPPETTRLTRRMTVTQAEGDRWALAARFRQELEILHGSAELVETPAEARMAIIARLTTWVKEEQAERRIEQPGQRGDWDLLTWDPELLPVAGLAAALTDVGFRLVIPTDLHKADDRESIRHVRLGISGVDAAFASTGSVLVGGGVRRSRAASLTPFRHLMLIPLSKLYPTAEDWMAERRTAGTLVSYLHESANVTIISGPSKSADIGGLLTLGVHGPKVVHAILFDDIEALIRSESQRVDNTPG
jgi:L-lactate dehydrogenase complex protein LldG